VLVNNNENYKAGQFRVQRQGRAPRSAANNNEYQGGEQGPGSWAGTPLLARESWSCRDTAQKKPGAVSRPGTPTQFQFHE
jgi:hypothetical protein